MAESESKFKKLLGSKITLFLLLLVFIWVTMNLINLSYKKFKMAEEVDNLKAQIVQVEQNNQQISAMIDYLGSESFLERQAKEKLNMKKEGEEVLILQPSAKIATSSPTVLGQVQPAGAKKESNLIKWLKYFFK